MSMSTEDIARAETVGFSQMVVPASMLGKGHRIGPYEIIRPLGRGGVGVVYHARVIESCALPVGREVALKVLRQEHLSEADHRRFTREAAYLQALSHHGITRIYDIGDYHGRPYMVMELVDGQCLDDLLNRRDSAEPSALAPGHASDLVIQVLEALHVAHIAGITHRDLKPGNLMITPAGQVKVLDFGMAQRVGGESRLTASGSILGTPAYMSPEQARGHREWIGAHSDIYAMGAVLYELVTGYQPFRAENSVAVLRAIIEEPLTPPSQLVPNLPVHLETIILTSMAKDPRDRYPSAESMAEDLRRFRRGNKPRAQRIPFYRPWLRAAYYHRSVIATSGLVLFAVSAVATAAIAQPWAQEKPPELTPTPILIANDAPDPWLTNWQHPESLGASITAAARWDQERAPGLTIFTPVQPDNRDRSITAESDVRIRFTAQHQRGGTPARILFSDRSLGQGYSLVLGENLRLKRPRLGESSQQLAIISSNPWPDDEPETIFTIERQGNVIEVYAQSPRLNNGPASLVLRHVDLIPLEGSDHSGIHFLIQPDSTAIRQITIERRRRSEMVSRLELGDALRQDGQFVRAERFYRDFLRDFPDSPRARDARYRRGLCLSALGRHNEALEVFLQVAAESENDPLYSVSASFQAWQSTLRLGRLSEAERYFESIRSRYDLATLLAYASEDLISALPQRYIDTARQEGPIDPWRAISLFDTAADIGEYLQLVPVQAAARIGAADILASLERWEEAEERLLQILANEQTGRQIRLGTLVRLAQMQRLREEYQAAEATYRIALELADNPHGDFAQWTRLWLSDLLTTMNRHTETYSLWNDLSSYDSLVGAIARNLLGPLIDMPLDGPPHRINDIAYFNAIAGILAGNRDRFEEWFQTALSLSEPFEWPQLLLGDAWQSEEHLMQTWHRYPSRINVRDPEMDAGYPVD
ncbi:MAG: hypothetical protein EA402_07115 [Planctomycetota bacterium]|nr:MAG: hypothetical protein EA402_07115 [Planctomycetota bacterium]